MVRQANQPDFPPLNRSNRSSQRRLGRKVQAANLPHWLKSGSAEARNSDNATGSPEVTGSVADSVTDSVAGSVTGSAEAQTSHAQPSSAPVSALPSPPHFPAIALPSSANPALEAISQEAISQPVLPDLSPQNLPQPPLPAATPRPQLRLPHLPQPWRWPAACLAVLGLFGSISMGAYVWLANLPPLPNCETITPLSPDAHRLYCAQALAQSGKLEDLVAGIELVKDWPTTHPLYRDAQNSFVKWSKRIALNAHEKMQQNDFQGAIETLNHIPPSSPIYADVQTTLGEWKKQWQEGEAIYAEAQEAIKQQNWGDAFNRVSELGYLEHDYWRLQQADGLAKQIFMQKKSREALNQSKKLAKKLMPIQMGEAIELLQGVEPGTDAWVESQTLLKTWSQQLLTIALQLWQEGNPTDAIKLAQQVPLQLDLAENARDLVWFSHAHKLVEESSIEAKLSWKPLWNLVEAVTALQKIQPDSLIYQDAQFQLQNWQAQFEDLQTLQAANLMASLGQKPALGAAIARAQEIQPDRQRYSQAQTLIASWLHKVEQLEDLPYLHRAQGFAAANTVESLQLAIAQANVIPSHRSLWSEAQGQMVSWKRQIEKIEDQPMLDKAQTLAKNNKLEEAIGAASEIRPERALYEAAQSAILTWKEKIRAAEIAADRSILDQAYSYAGSSQLTDAIATAAQLPPGRPLYLEAQAAIGAWLRERDGIKPGLGEEPMAEPSASESMSSGDASSEPASSTTEATSGESDASLPSSTESGESRAPVGEESAPAGVEEAPMETSPE